MLASSSLLGVFFGLLFNKNVALATHSILVHSLRLPVLSWLATAVIAGAVIGFMWAAGLVDRPGHRMGGRAGIAFRE